jgi:hypothetical protein
MAIRNSAVLLVATLLLLGLLVLDGALLSASSDPP